MDCPGAVINSPRAVIPTSGGFVEPVDFAGVVNWDSVVVCAGAAVDWAFDVVETTKLELVEEEGAVSWVIPED